MWRFTVTQNKIYWLTWNNLKLQDYTSGSIMIALIITLNNIFKHLFLVFLWCSSESWLFTLLRSRSDLYPSLNFLPWHSVLFVSRGKVRPALFPGDFNCIAFSSLPAVCWSQVAEWNIVYASLSLASENSCVGPPHIRFLIVCRMVWTIWWRTWRL